MLDNIEDNVNSAVLHTGAGAESLGKAVQEQKKGRKVWYIVPLIYHSNSHPTQKLYIILAILIILLILALSLGLGISLKPKKSSM